MQRYSNIIQALVYAGAAFLVVIVGLRGLGDLSSIEVVPKWLLDDNTGRISVNIVMFGLIAEFAILIAFAALFLKAPVNSVFAMSETRAVAGTTQTTPAEIARLIETERQIIETLGKRTEALIESERRIIEQIGEKYNEVAESQRQILELISRRVSENHVRNDEVLNRIDTNVDFLKSAHLVRRRTITEGSPTMS